MNNIKKIIYLVCVVSVMLVSCSKDKLPLASTSAQFNIGIQVGNEPLEWNTVKYFNAAGNKYGIELLNFYISNVSFKQASGENYTSSKVFYIDPSNVSTSSFILESIPPGTYSEMTFLVGIDPIQNKTQNLPPTLDNFNMAWPDFMGGGYHFMKFEGHYMDVAAVEKGFAIHLGRNENSKEVKITKMLNQNSLTQTYSLIFDLNEVFKNPYTYDFNKELSYTMMDSLAMNKIKNNLSDAFNLVQNK